MPDCLDMQPLICTTKRLITVPGIRAVRSRHLQWLLLFSIA